MPPRKRPSQANLAGGARKAARVSSASTPSGSQSASRSQARPPPASKTQAPPVTTAAARLREEQRLQYQQQQQQQYPTYEDDEHEVIDLTQAVEREEREFYGTLGRFLLCLVFVVLFGWGGCWFYFGRRCDAGGSCGLCEGSCGLVGERAC